MPPTSGGRLRVMCRMRVAAEVVGAITTGGLASGGETDSGDGPIKLGMLAPFSGSEAAFGDYMKFGAQLAIDEVNADGGVAGRDLELDVVVLPPQEDEFTCVECFLVKHRTQIDHETSIGAICVECAA